MLVTGASSGIGRQTAIECSRMGASVVLSARNEVRLLETLSSIEGEGHKIIPADLLNQDQIKGNKDLVNEILNDGIKIYR